MIWMVQKLKGAERIHMLNRKNLIFLGLTSIMLANCAHVKTGQVSSKISFAIGEIQSIEMRRLMRDERVRELKNGDIVVSNACGNSVTKFEIIESTGYTKKHLKDDSGIGEWCRPRYDFEIGTYFLVVDTKGDSILDFIPIEVESNALLLDPETVKHWKKDYGDLPIELTWGKLESPAFYPVTENAYDPLIIEYAREFDHIVIEPDEDGYQRVLYTHGYKLSDIFSQSE